LFGLENRQGKPEVRELAGWVSFLRTDVHAVERDLGRKLLVRGGLGYLDQFIPRLGFHLAVAQCAVIAYGCSDWTHEH
jgi:hypothetical protein